MTLLWIDNICSLFELDFESSNGIINVLTLVVVLLMVTFHKRKDFMVYGMVAIVALVLFSETLKEGFTSKPCRPSTTNNPMSNVPLAEYGAPQKYSGACDSLVADTVREEQLSSGVFFDTAMNKSHYERQFSTNAVTSVPSDQTSFAKWCYDDHYNCKQGSVYMDDPDAADGMIVNCSKYGMNDPANQNVVDYPKGS